MNLFYPYNEILPKKRAHDVFIFQQCAALTHLGCEVSLLIGSGSESKEELFRYYAMAPTPKLKIMQLPIVRKNNPFNLSWNYPFFSATQRRICKEKPDWVILSVFKQGHYHFSKKVKGIRYLYEVHELTTYPHLPISPLLAQEKAMLSLADRIITTTEALKELLLNPPYSLTNPIDVIPLAAIRTPLPEKEKEEGKLTLAYVGQLYPEQGIATLLEAIKKTSGVHLLIIGGKVEEITHYRALAEKLSLTPCVTFLGFVPPKDLTPLVADADAFVAPFEKQGRMPYVAHTKLHEYAAWGRPFLASNLPPVREHFSPENGVLLFEPGNPTSLAHSLSLLQNKDTFRSLQQAARRNVNRFTWHSRATHYQQTLLP